MEGDKHLQKNSSLERQAQINANLGASYAPMSLSPELVGRNPEEAELATKILVAIEEMRKKNADEAALTLEREKNAAA